MADIQNGTFNLAAATAQAFRSPGVSKEAIGAFRAIAVKVREKEATPQQAAAEVAQLGTALGMLWAMIGNNEKLIDRLIVLIALYFAIMGPIGQDATDAKRQVTDDQHLSVAKQQLALDEAQLAALRTTRQDVEKLRQDFERSLADEDAKARTARSRSPAPTIYPMPPNGPSRQVRRAQAKAWKRRPPR